MIFYQILLFYVVSSGCIFCCDGVLDPPMSQDLLIVGGVITNSAGYGHIAAPPKDPNFLEKLREFSVTIFPRQNQQNPE